MSKIDEKRDLLKLQIEMEEQRHKNKMEELKYMRETNMIAHEKELERNRIKSAEIRKTQLRKYGDPYVH